MSRLSPSAWAIVSSTSGLVVGAMVLGDLDLFLRPPVVLLYLLVCPGMAIARLFRIDTGLLGACVAVGLSFFVDAVASGILAYSGAWSPTGALGILIAITLIASATEVLRSGADRSVGTKTERA